MPSATLRNRLARLEAAQGAHDDDAYWAAVMEREPIFVETFGKLVKNEISLEQWESWLDENPHPDRGRPLTPQEEREAEESWAEFWRLLEQTRQRLISSGIILENFNNPPAKVSRHASDNTPSDEALECHGKPAELAADKPEPSAPPSHPARSQPAHSQRRPSDHNHIDLDGPTRAAARKQSRLTRAAG